MIKISQAPPVATQEIPLAVEAAKGLSTEILHVHSTKPLRDTPTENDIAIAAKNYLVMAGSDGTMPRKLCARLIQILNLSGV